jgi:hypothetical protein
LYFKNGVDKFYPPPPLKWLTPPPEKNLVHMYEWVYPQEVDFSNFFPPFFKKKRRISLYHNFFLIWFKKRSKTVQKSNKS